MQIRIYQIGSRCMLEIEGGRIAIKNYEVSNSINGKTLKVEIPLNRQFLFLGEKAQLPKEKIEKDKDEKISEPDAEIHIIVKDGTESTQLSGNPSAIVNALGRGLAAVFSKVTEPDIPLTKLEEIANETRDSLLRIMCRMKGYQ